MTKLEREFWVFHEENPNVYELFKRFADEVRAAGHVRYSSDAILHRVRWHTNVTVRSRGFKINDHFSAYYARLWLSEHPQHENFFETRALAVERAA